MEKIRQKGYTVLRKSEQFFKTDMIYLAKGGVWLTIAQGVSSLSAFFLSIAFANFLPPDIFGMYKYILSIVSILTVLTLTGINTSVFQSVAKGYEGDLLPGLKARIKWGLLGSLAGLGMALYYYLNGNHTLTFAFLIVSVFLPLTEPLGIYDSLLQGKRLFKKSTQFFSISQITITLVTVITLFLTHNLFLILLAYFLSRIIIRLFFLLLSIKKFITNKNIDPHTNTFGKHLSFMKGIGTVSGNLNSIALFHFLGGQAVSVFSIALAPVEQIRAIMKSGENLLIPKAVLLDWSVFNLRVFLKKIIPFIVILSAGILLYIVLAPTLYKILFPAYSESVIYTQIFSVSLIFSAINILLLGILRAKRSTKALHVITIVDTMLSLGLVIPMIYYFGILGLVISLIAIKIFDIFMMSFFVFRKTANSEKRPE